MESIPAAERVPIEVWHDILAFALGTWLVPGDGNNIFDDVALYTVGCASSLEYRRVEDIKKRMRAVCQSWKSFVDEFCVELVVSDFLIRTAPSEPHLLRASRIEFPVSWNCSCRQCLYTFPQSMTKAGTAYWAITEKVPSYGPKFESSFKPERARVILLDTARRQMVDYLKYAPLLTAYGGKLCTVAVREQLPESSFLDRLTHLALYDLSPEEMVLALHLPRLRFLHLRLDHEGLDQPPETYVPLEDWVIPNLTSLVVDGPVGGTYYDDLLRFLRKFSPTIENLIMHHYVLVDGNSQPQHIDIRHLRQYPRLKSLGVSVIALDEEYGKFDMVDEEDTPLRLSLLLTDIHEIFSRDNERLTATAQRCIRLCTPPDTIFDKVMMFHSWDQLLRQWDADEQRLSGNSTAPSTLHSAWLFFKEISQADIKFLDRDGVNLQRGSGLRFLERLKQAFE